MEVLAGTLFILALADQYLTNRLQDDGHLIKLLQRARWRRQQVAVRVLGGLLVVLFLFAIGRHT